MMTPKAIAALYASARHPGGASATGAIVKKAASHRAGRIPPRDKMLITTKLFQVAWPRLAPVILECDVHEKAGT
jgi:hypothetical protein